MIVDKWDYRITDICKSAELFINESSYPISYSEENSKEYLWALYNQPDIAIMAKYVGDIFCGWAIIAKEKEFHNEFFGYFMKFYVMPNARGTMVAREMIEEITNWFDKNKCVLSFATPTANIGQNKTFINLLKKFDYVYDGYSLTRKLQDVKI